MKFSRLVILTIIGLIVITSSLTARRPCGGCIAPCPYGICNATFGGGLGCTCCAIAPGKYCSSHDPSTKQKPTP